MLKVIFKSINHKIKLQNLGQNATVRFLKIKLVETDATKDIQNYFRNQEFKFYSALLTILIVLKKLRVDLAVNYIFFDVAWKKEFIVAADAQHSMFLAWHYFNMSS